MNKCVAHKLVKNSKMAVRRSCPIDHGLRRYEHYTIELGIQIESLSKHPRHRRSRATCIDIQACAVQRKHNGFQPFPALPSTDASRQAQRCTSAPNTPRLQNLHRTCNLMCARLCRLCTCGKQQGLCQGRAKMIRSRASMQMGMV